MSHILLLVWMQAMPQHFLTNLASENLSLTLEIISDSTLLNSIRDNNTQDTADIFSAVISDGQ